MGHRAHLILYSTALITLSHVSFVLLPGCSGCFWGVISLTLLGIGFSIYAVVTWAAIPLIVLDKAQGTAFGVSVSFLYTGLATAPLAIGKLIDGTTEQEGFFWPSILFILLGTIATGVAILLIFADTKAGGVLKKAAAEDSSKKEVALLKVA
mmetsp:Transcript_7170/g.13150  ORF Transcript_7170/g.13150 Transcript_7170/m.13150 type:complete len:152 (-) Transcript_7170:110-565(-)